MERFRAQRRRRWAAPCLMIAGMLGMGCYGPLSFLAQVDNKTGLPREVRVVSESKDRRAELRADVAPGGSAVLDAEGTAWAEVDGVRRFEMDRSNAAVEIWERPGAAPAWPRTGGRP